MEILKNSKKEIIVSLLVGIFLICIQPLLNWLGDSFVWLYLLISDKFSIEYYTSIARNDPYIDSNINQYLLILIIATILLAYIIYYNNKGKAMKKRIGYELKEIKNTADSFNQSKSKQEKNKEEILIELMDKEETLKFQKERFSKRWKNYILFLIIYSIFFVSVLLANLAIRRSVASENIEFRNNLIKVAPYTSEFELKLIQSKWASMKNKSDYDIIKKNVQDLKNKNKIE